MFIRISLSRSRELGIVVQSQHTLLVYRWLIPGFLLPWDDDDDDDYSFSSFWFVLIFVLAPVFFLIWFSQVWLLYVALVFTHALPTVDTVPGTCSVRRGQHYR